MPKETVHWGKQYIARKMEPMKGVDGAKYEYDLELPFEGIPEGGGLPDTDTVVRSPKIEIFWDKPNANHLPLGEDDDGFVQLGLVIDEYEFQKRVKEAPEDSGVRDRGFYTKKLSRSQINEMIRVLKRARNAAYGADE